MQRPQEDAEEAEQAEAKAAIANQLIKALNGEPWISRVHPAKTPAEAGSDLGSLCLLLFQSPGSG
jgi:hypothetical protein